ncbi:chloride channel protein 1 isoform X4 [Xenopus laevis]|uniref:Chloride channel protein 1 isoform X4 n=1 Tax=Xenopus laevis TaxID=8355 RepID=A0A8J0USP0_XENLA|nr:chloride channel protein 1 isoform X4 [Xenopus laevis]
MGVLHSDRLEEIHEGAGDKSVSEVERKEKCGESKAESEMSEAYSYTATDKDQQGRLHQACGSLTRLLRTMGLALRRLLLRLGEDWIFLFLLGISMATISFGLDVSIAKLQRANLWVYDSLDHYLYLQYFSWVLFHVLLMMTSAAVAKYISPQAAGPICAYGYHTCYPARQTYGETCWSQGGVLFSVETTATHFAVRNYWRGFFAATCAALMFRLLAVINREKETVAILFSTNWRVEFPFDLPEYLSYAILGVVCGCVCCVYLFLHRTTLLFLQNDTRISKFLRNNRIVYAAFVSWVLASVTFPHGFGQYLGGTRLTMKEHLETFFNNITWGVEELSLGANITGQPPNPSYDNNWLQWTHPNMSTVEILACFVVLKFFLLLLANTMIIPAGYFLPVFVYGAGLGRLYGEIMAKIFQNGFISEGIPIKITPAGYALAGAAAYSGAVTHTLSTALLVFELSGQMSHILPVLIAVLIANAISQSYQNSFFDLIVIIKKLPYLPKLKMGQNSAHDICAEDFMVTNLQYLIKGFKYRDIRSLLKSCDLKQFPIVDSEESKILLGSVSRKILTKLLADQLSPERRIQYMLDKTGGNFNSDFTVSPEKSDEQKIDECEYTDPIYSAQETVVYESEEKHKTHTDTRRRCSAKFKSQYLKMVEEWECHQLNQEVPLEYLTIDPAPYRLLEKETLYQCYDLFNLLGLRMAYVTRLGRLVGVVSLTEIKEGVDGSVKGTFSPRTQEETEETLHLNPLTPGANSS